MEPASLEAVHEENQRLRALLQQHGIPLPSDTSRRPEPLAAPAHAQEAEATACPRAGPFLVSTHGLSKQHVERYSRQLLLPSFGLEAQQGLCKGSVLIVGCGGLGSPAALYLAAAGVGRIGLVDHDVVDLSNLHRQVIHTEQRVGRHKALSAAESVRALNSLVQVDTHTEGFTPANALHLVSQYDVVLDASDNPPTRYLISDACVVAGKPLVSAAAVGTDGQLTVYNSGPDVPCYRCLFPEAPAPENCSRCVDAGVLGPVPGVMGVLQALEVVKLLSGVGDVMARKLLIFDALSGRFTTVKLRGRRPECVACGAQPAVTTDTLASYDYVAFTGQAAQDGPLPPIAILPDHERLTVHQFKALLEQHNTANTTLLHQPDSGANKTQSQGPPRQPAMPILDVRPGTQVALFSFPGALHIPYERLEGRLEEVRQLVGTTTSVDQGNSTGACSSTCESHPRPSAEDGSVTGGPQILPQDSVPRLVVLCRRGNNSQRAVTKLRQAGFTGVVDVIGGVDEWVHSVQEDVPKI